MMAAKILRNISFCHPVSHLCTRCQNAVYPEDPPNQLWECRSRRCLGQDRCQWLDRFLKEQVVRSQCVLSFSCLRNPCCHPAVTSIVPTGLILCVVLQAGERIDGGGPGADLLPDIVGEGIIIAFYLSCRDLTLCVCWTMDSFSAGDRDSNFFIAGSFMASAIAKPMGMIRILPRLFALL